MKIHWLFFGILLSIGQHAYGMTNLFNGNGGDESWSNAANWSLGIVPNATHDVTVAVGKVVKVMNGTNAVARSVYLTGDNELVIFVDASLDIVEYIYVFTGAQLTNRGNLTFLSGCEGLRVSEGGIVLNNDTIIILQPAIGIDFRGGTITNNEKISIEGAGQMGISMLLAVSHPNQRNLINNAGATISITNPDGYGIYLSDTITNYGDILIDNIDRDAPNIPAEGMYIVSFGKLLNSGYISIHDSEDYCLHNDQGTMRNEATGVIDLEAFQDIGFLNEAISDNYGELNINCTVLTPGNRGIHLLNPLTNRTGGHITIHGHDILDMAIEVDQTFTNETGADISIDQFLYRGILVDDGGFNNYGTVEIGEINDLLGYGIEAYSYFNNHGSMTFENMGSGIRNVTSVFNNYGTLTFHNLLSKAIFSDQKLTNHTGANIVIYNDDGSRISWGITHIDDAPNEDFVNNGSIYMDSVNVGLDLRIGDFINNGLLFINHFRFGIDFGQFFDPAVFTNNGDLSIRNQEEPLAYSIYVEGGDLNTFNFFNHDTATIDLLNVERGFLITSGMQNEGLITMTNVAQKGFYLSNFTNTFQCKNTSTGSIVIDNAQYGVYLGTGGSADNLNSFINDGSITFKSMADYGITGDNTIGIFENNGAVIGNAEINCDYVMVENDFYPGNNVGSFSFDNYQSASPTYHIQMKGNNGPGNPNGHDIIIVNSSFNLASHLEVTTLPGFAPLINNLYTIVLSTGTITGTFLSTDLPDLGPSMEFEVQYFNDKVKLKVVPKYSLWTGTLNHSWNNINNWAAATIPDENTYVKIPAGAPNYPILQAGSLSIGTNTGTFKCKSLRIEAGANINTVNAAMDVHDAVDVYGTFYFHTSGSDQVHVFNDGGIIVYTNGVFNIQQF